MLEQFAAEYHIYKLRPKPTCCLLIFLFLLYALFAFRVSLLHCKSTCI